MDPQMIDQDRDILTVNPYATGWRANVIQPEPSYHQMVRDSMAFLVFKWSLFSQLIYDSMDIIYTDSVPLAATDHFSIMLNPTGLIAAGINDIPQTAYVLGHEAGHRFLNDIPTSMVFRAAGVVPLPNGKTLPFVDEIANIAQDYRINAMLNSCKLGVMPKIALFNEQYSVAGMEPWVEIYEKIFKNVKIVKGGSGGFDMHIPPDPRDVRKDDQKREQQIITAVQIANRQNPGSVPGAIQRLVDEIVNPKVPWQQHLKSTMQRKAGQPQLDWKQANRRLAGRPDPLYFAKKGHRGAGLVVIAIDTSGSINGVMINRFFAEAAGIVADLNPFQLIVLWCDASIHRVDEIDEPMDLTELHADVKTKGVGGGGGTSFKPVFEKIKDMNVMPDMLVYLTDTYGDFPSHQPEYSVIWGSITPSPRVPWGEVVEVEL